MKAVFKKRVMLTLILFWFIPQVYVVSDCLSKGPCVYNYKFNLTFLILLKLLPSLFTDIFVAVSFAVLILIALAVSFLVSTLVIKEKRF